MSRDNTFLRAMFEDGAHTFDWEFAVGWITEAVHGYSMGVITSKQLIDQVIDLEASARHYRAGLEYGLTEDQVIDALRRHAASAPVGGDSPTGVGSPPR